MQVIASWHYYCINKNYLYFTTNNTNPINNYEAKNT